MADLKISQLNSNTAAAGDEIAINRGGVNYKITAGDVANLAAAPTEFSGNISDSVLLFDNKEKITVNGTGANATINFDVLESQVQYINANATGNWTLNVRGNSSEALNTVMDSNQAITIAVLAQQGSTAYFNNLVQVDGTNVSALWQGGSAPTAGNADSTDVYTYNVLKTANATFTVLASQTQFKA